MGNTDDVLAAWEASGRNIKAFGIHLFTMLGFDLVDDEHELAQLSNFVTDNGTFRIPKLKPGHNSPNAIHTPMISFGSEGDLTTHQSRPNLLDQDSSGGSPIGYGTPSNKKIVPSPQPPP